MNAMHRVCSHSSCCAGWRVLVVTTAVAACTVATLLFVPRWAAAETKKPAAADATIIAHRGFTFVAPENTLPAFRAALDAGYGFECDVYASKDGVPVIIHDPTVDRTTDGSGRIEQMTLDQIKRLDAGSWFDERFAGQRIPTLDEVLRLVAEHPEKKAVVALHLKRWDEPLLKKTIALLAKYDLFDRTFVFDQPLDVSRRIKQLEPRVNTVLADFRDRRKYADPQAWAEVLDEPYCDGVWIHFVPSAEQMRLAHERHKPVYIYLFTDSKNPDTWRRGAELGVIFCLDDVADWCRAVGKAPPKTAG